MSEATPAELARRLADLPELAGSWEEVDLAAGQTLFREGDPGDAFYTVISGALEVHRSDDQGRPMVLERLGPGQHLGELALVLDDRRAATVKALSDCRLRRLGRDAFRAALPRLPALSAATLDMLGIRLRRTGTYLSLLTRWAHLVAKGDYQGAQDAIHAEAAGAEDGNLAAFVGAFESMVSSVRAREEALSRELAQLRIEIDQQQLQSRLAEVTETDFFRQLQTRAGDLRRRMRGAGDPPAATAADADAALDAGLDA